MNWYLFSGYAVFWVLVFLYVLYIHRKQSKLNRDLQVLADQLED